MMKRIYFQCLLLSVLFGVAGCGVPKSARTDDSVKAQLPLQFRGDSVAESSASVAPWKQFFTDPALVSLIDTALAGNQDLKIALQEIVIAKSDMLYQSGRLLPSVTAGGAVGVSKPGRYTSEGAGNATTDIEPGKAMPDPLMDYQAGVNAGWEVDLWHKLSSGKRAAAEHYLATVEGRNAVQASLIAEVANTYYHLLALDNKLDLIREYVDLQAKAAQIARIQKEADADTELAVDKFEAELAKARSVECSLMQEVTESENCLNLLLGRYPMTIERNKSVFLSEDLRQVLAGVPADLLDNRPDIRQAEHELASAKFNVAAARKEFLPSLTISASLGLDAFNPSYLTRMPESLAYGLAGGLAGPLVNRKAIRANFQAADARQVEALCQYDQTLLSAYSEVCTLMSRIRNMDEYYQLKQKEADKLDQSVDIANQLYLNGRCTYLDVLLDQRDALDAKMELIEAKELQLSTMTEVYRSVGGGQK